MEEKKLFVANRSSRLPSKMGLVLLATLIGLLAY